MSYANNKGAYQPAHPHILISAFVFRCLDSVMSLVSVTKNFKHHASFCSWADSLESDLVGNSRRHVFSWRCSFITIPAVFRVSEKQPTVDMPTSFDKFCILVSHSEGNGGRNVQEEECVATKSGPLLWNKSLIIGERMFSGIINTCT